MAIENIRVHNDIVLFTDRTPDDFTATICLTRDELMQLVAAMLPACPYCHTANTGALICPGCDMTATQAADAQANFLRIVRS